MSFASLRCQDASGPSPQAEDLRPGLKDFMHDGSIML